MKEEFYQIADELRAIANAGLYWTESGYDKERYERVLRTSARLVAAVENSSMEDIYAQYTGNMSHLSPVLCVEAALFRDGKILLIQRSDDSSWAMPGGLLEVGESPAQGAERELWEEAGIRGKAIQLLALYDSRYWPARTRIQLCTAQFLMQSDDSPSLHTSVQEVHSSLAETLDIGFFAEDQLPQMHIGHERRVPMAFKLFGGEANAPFFDADF